MHHRIVLFLVIAAAIISTAQLATVVGDTSPYTSSIGVMWNFYISFFICQTSIGGIAGYALRRRIRSQRANASISTSLRQSGLVAIVVLLSLFFNTLGILEFWNVAPLVLAAILIEFFFQAEKRPHAHIEYEKE